MDDFDGVGVEVDDGGAVVVRRGTAEGGFAVDAAAGFEGGDEEGVDGGAGGGGEGDVCGAGVFSVADRRVVSACFFVLRWGRGIG